MPNRPALDPEALLAEVGWVRALAQRVVRDPDAADDLAQDAFLVALSAGDARPRSPRAWLHGVVRNLARTVRRSGERRERREGEVACREAGPSTLELVERAATQRAVVGALLELDEPYRSTLLMRFFEGLSARDVARRVGLSESTVASRTSRGARPLARAPRRRRGRE